MPPVISENRELSGKQKGRVLYRVRKRGFRCGNCGSEDFEVGEALELGFLFLSEEHDTYMVALTCRERGCEAPRTGIRLRGHEFLPEEGGGG
jgi:hypothetical protein